MGVPFIFSQREKNKGVIVVDTIGTLDLLWVYEGSFVIHALFFVVKLVLCIVLNWKYNIHHQRHGTGLPPGKLDIP